MKSSYYYSHGKLLLTGEYAVLSGAKSLAIPTEYGQKMKVSISENTNTIHWENIDYQGNIWFKYIFPISALSEERQITNPIAQRLYKLLSYIYTQNANLFNTGLKVTNYLSFPIDWGLGTSSTFINNLASWSGLNPFELLWKVFKGSGCDIACASSNTPIIYQLKETKPIIQSICFNPSFTDNMYFVFLQNKKDTQEAIQSYQNKQTSTSFVKEISSITEKCITAIRLEEFCTLIDKHENILSDYLGIQKVKDLWFDDFKGSIKSIGAWGGDFILIVSQKCPKQYFIKRGFNTIIPFREMVFSP